MLSCSYIQLVLLIYQYLLALNKNVTQREKNGNEKHEKHSKKLHHVLKSKHIKSNEKAKSNRINSTKAHLRLDK